MKLWPCLLAALFAGCAGNPVRPSPGVVIAPSANLETVWEAALELSQTFPPEQILIALDLDNTLLAAHTELGADQWYDWQRELQKDHPCHPDLVTNRLAVQGALYHSGAMRLTEPGIGQLLEKLRGAGHPVMIVTARGPDFRLSTFRELRRNNLNFMNFSRGKLTSSGTPFSLPPGSRAVLYEDGVLMLAGQHKGRMLLALLDHFDLDRPAAVVFADDKTRNIEAMRESLNEAGVAGRLLHYTREQSRVEAFDAAGAAAAWRQAEPALLTLQRLMGDYNYQLPETAPTDCSP